MKSLINALAKDIPLGRPLAMVVVIVGLFALAWLIGRIAVGRSVLRRPQRAARGTRRRASTPG